LTKNGPAGAGNTPEPGQPSREAAVNESSAPNAHLSTEGQDLDHQGERPHACNDGWVTIGQLVVDEDTGEETEEFALYLCRRCSDSRR
jgi:hypothetical protein